LSSGPSDRVRRLRFRSISSGKGGIDARLGSDEGALF
jgi:hypothetical protein